MNSKVYKWCAVPQCKNTSIKMPNKVFVHVPNKKIIRDKWLKLARRNPNDVVANSPLYFCEDHFDLPNDMENYMEYHVMGSVSQVRMKPRCMPHKFTCQQDRKTRTSDTTELPYIAKKRKKMILEKRVERKKEFEEKFIVTEQSSFEEIASGSSVQQNVEEVPQVNTMSDLFVCRTCLSFSTKTHVINNSPLQETLEKLTNRKLDGLRRIVLCYICYAQLQKCRKFVDMSWKSEVIHAELINKSVEITQETLSHLGWKQTYAVTPIVQFYNGFKYDSEGNVKEDPTEYDIAVKVEKIEIEEIEEQIDSTANEIALKAEPVFIDNEVVIKEELMWLEEDIDVEGEVTLYDNFDADSDGQLEEKDVDVEDISGSETVNLNINITPKETKEQLHFECNICSRTYRTKSDLQNHKKVHKTQFTCDVCNETFTLKLNIVRHMKMHSGELYTCVLCQKVFRHERYLKEHVRIHTKEKPYVCDYCGKLFTDRSSLYRHRKSHWSNEKTHICGICNRKFLRKSHLKSHLITHTGLKPYKCNVCNHSFTQQCTLTGHLRIHTGEKTHYCKDCGKGFYRKGHLHQHMRVHTGWKPYECDKCDRKLTSTRNLARHVCKTRQTLT